MHNLNFEVLPNSSVNHLLVYNLSVWDGSPVSPQYRILLPGATIEQVVPITDTYQTIDKDSVGYSTDELPDGIWTIVLRTGADPYQTLTKQFLRINAFWEQYKSLLLKLEHSEFSVREDKIIKGLLYDIDILISSAQACAETGLVSKATELYEKAQKILSRVTNQANV